MPKPKDPNKVNRGFVKNAHRKSNFKAGTPSDPYLSKCKRCDFAVFNWQDHEWSSKDPVGYSHTDCEARLDNYVARVYY